MSIRARIAGLVLILGVVLFVIELARRRKMGEMLCLLWLSSLFGVVFLVLNQSFTNALTKFVGAVYPVSALSLFAFFFIVIILIYSGIRISNLERQVKELSQYIALSNTEISRDLQSRDK